MYRKRVFGIRPADDEQKPISLFHNRYHNQRVAEVRNQETDSGVSVGFRPLPQTTPTTCSAWPGSTGELRPPDRNRAGRRQIFAPPVQNSAPDTAQLTPINAPTPASHPMSPPKRRKPTRFFEVSSWPRRFGAPTFRWARVVATHPIDGRFKL